MKFVVFGGFLLLSGAIIYAAMIISGNLVNEILYVAMGIGLLSCIYGLFKKDS